MFCSFLSVSYSCLFLSNLAFATPTNVYGLPTQGEHGEPPGSSAFWYKVIASIGLVLAGGVFAGLTLGLMGLDELHLRVLAASSDDPKERSDAQIVLRLLTHRRHWVLVVLLLGNVIVNESLPIFLDSALGGGLAAVVTSTTLIVIFGLYVYELTKLIQAPALHDREIIPQAVSVRYGLSIGASCAPVVLGMMYLFAPIAYPIAKLLDYILGANDAHTYKKAELKSFLAFHRQGEEPLRDEEISILNGVLELNNKHVETIMTPMADVVTISSDKILDHDTVDFILRSGYSRIPVHKPGRPLAFEGLLLIKKLSVYDPSQDLPVSKFTLSILPEAHPSINCFQALDYLYVRFVLSGGQSTDVHQPDGSRTSPALEQHPGVEGGAIGVVTLEDIIEEIISEEIVDETDRYEDNQSKRRAKRLKNAKIMRGIVEYRVSRANSQSTLPVVGDRAPLLGSNGHTASSANQGHNSGTENGDGAVQPSPEGSTGSVATVKPNGTSQYGSVTVGSPSKT